MPLHLVLHLGDRGTFVAEEVGLPTHEGEKCVEEVVDTLSVLDGTHEESIKLFVILYRHGLVFLNSIFVC